MKDIDEFHDEACHVAYKYGFKPTEVQVVQTTINKNRMYYCKTYNLSGGKSLTFEGAIFEFEQELIKHKQNAATISKAQRN